jgi:hypothetical protein
LDTEDDESDNLLEIHRNENRGVSEVNSVPETVVPDLGIGDASTESDGTDAHSDDNEEGVTNLHRQATELETWQDELEQDIGNLPTEIKDWAILRAQIKADLKKNSRKLSLSDINKLMILSNFATLRLKGRSHMQASLEIAEQWHDSNGVWFARKVRALARHYQTFEQLPVEHRGGYRNARLPTYRKSDAEETPACYQHRNSSRSQDHTQNTYQYAHCSPLADKTWLAIHTCQKRCLYGRP